MQYSILRQNTCLITLNCNCSELSEEQNLTAKSNARTAINAAESFSHIQKKYYFDYKLHLVCDENSVVHSFDFTPANVHDVNYLKDIKYSLQNCELIGDRRYIGAECQQNMITCSQIQLSVPMRSNALNPMQVSPVKRRKRKRTETLISQFDGQFSMNFNYTKTFDGLATRVIFGISTIAYIINYFF